MNDKKTSLFLHMIAIALTVSLLLVGVRIMTRLDTDSEGTVNPNPSTDADEIKKPDQSDSSDSGESAEPDHTESDENNGKQILQMSDYKKMLGTNNNQYWLALCTDGLLKPLTHYTLTWSFDSVLMKSLGASFIYRPDANQVSRPAVMYYDSPIEAPISPDLTFLRSNDTAMCTGTENFATGSNPNTAFFYVLAFSAANDEEAVLLAREIYTQCIVSFTLTER